MNKENFVAPQVVCIFLLNLFTLMYVGSVKALIGKEVNRMDVTNESFEACIAFWTVVFADFN